MFTITEAAKQTSLTRAAIHKAIKTGRLSASKDDNGNYRIDAAELFRVYRKVDSTSKQNHTETPALVDTVDYRLIAQRLEFTERLLRQTENERDNLRLSLNQAMSLITHQQEQQPESRPVKSLLFEKLFGKR
ncbi:MAG: hypothetical protein WCH01_14595 [Methylococcaceae bacterium]